MTRTRGNVDGAHVAALSFEIDGCGTLSLLGADERTHSYVRSQMNPCVPSAAYAPPDVVIEAAEESAPPVFTDVQNPARDATVTASDGVGFYVVYNGLTCRLPDSFLDRPARFSADPGFPLSRIFGPVVRPVLQVGALERDSVVLHSASVVVDGAGVIVAGWSETGKTETALALIERGAVFLSDKWTVVRPDGTIGVFPISVGIRRWALAYLPRLRSSLPAAARAQFMVAGMLSVAARPARLLPSRGRVAGLAHTALERATMMADRAALSPTQVREAYDQPPAASWAAELRVVAHLTTVSDGRVEAKPAEPAWAARRLARSAAFERRAAFELYERRRFAFPGSPAPSLEDVVQAEERLLERAFANALVLDVRAPFPTDPRPVAEAIARFL